MSEFPLAASEPERLPASTSDADEDLRPELQRLVMLPLVVVALLGIAVAVVLALDTPVELRYAALGVGGIGCIAVLLIGFRKATATATELNERSEDSSKDAQRSLIDNARRERQWIETLRKEIAQGREELPQLVERVQAGDQPAPRWPTGEPGASSDPFELLSYEIRQAQAAAEFAVVRMQQFTESGAAVDPSVAVFANIARRVQSLAHRAIQRLDDLEQRVEDPDLLKGLFAVDHLVTGVRRQAESLAVLGGSMPRRQWSQPVAMYTVLRSAVAEVEHYARVKVIPPVDGTLHGHAVADVIHLVAELVENATSFSEPDTQVTVSTQRVTAGMAIDIRDRGLGMSPADRTQLNELLANPGTVDRDERLKDGRIGLYVVAQIGQRHQVAVELENNMYGGTDAHVVIPNKLLGEVEDGEPERSPVDAIVAPEPAPQPEPAAAPEPVAAPEPPPRQEPVARPEPVAAPEPVAPEPAAKPEPAIRQERIEAWPAPPEPVHAPENGTRRGVHRAPVESMSGGSNGNSAPSYGRHTGVVPAEKPSSSDTTMQFPRTQLPSEPTPTGQFPGEKVLIDEKRPPLPRRDRTKSYVAPELAGGPRTDDTPRGGPNPGLWASFRQGVEGGVADRRPDDQSG
ncbi:Histidine kinase-, DNA gyrase B-, and HSP90-like ATPase [Saccharopolyspora kobensis]|uniref:histidine kinase n=1 Tax=Saccharopolyspora kobensis TaxID=146035 RepID=A0A1H6DTP9_9PSEU|nr:ATP-binding protein [Saccharopolyspora kobensis]SEG88609.1 Histidine kinase-, DNA gyrase B-, and HSP90-like ATPase [Saccharopolyspora kobensis]SFD99789.1 Histidine kinase-, DNA gyrase B-, and HSP90-like ATPase [Saccharopolyspora kobensis]